MAQALALAWRGAGLTRPNPPVGALLVRNGRIVGQGWHKQAGGAHAEIIALRQAGARARGATLYVTLEPCSTQGRTPPCTAALMEAGVERVVAAARDPNPRHAGRGLTILRRAGIAVKAGTAVEEARRLIAPFAHWLSAGRPQLILKLAASLDGKIADGQGRSRWISGPPARRLVHVWRRQTDAIMVGAGTVLADNPSLTPRPAGGRRPWRVVLDSSGRVSPTARLLADGLAAQTIIATTRHCPADRLVQWRAAGATVWVLPATSAGVSPLALLRRLGKIGCLQVVCEGGGILATSLLRANLVDELRLFLAPILLGSQQAAGLLGGTGWSLPAAPRLSLIEQQRVGDDLLITARPRRAGVNPA